MNTKQIIKMGYEAGLCDEDGADDNSIYIDEHLTRFAKLVAAAEREACAQLCDDSVEYAGSELARQIRARK